MGFAESLENIVKPAVGPKCSVCTTVNSLPVAEQKVILAAFDDTSVRTSYLRRAFLAEGYSFSNGTVGRHRRKECRR